jgi:hypothetical protein
MIDIRIKISNALFEGGYYHPDLGPHVHSFCQGFK